MSQTSGNIMQLHVGHLPPPFSVFTLWLFNIAMERSTIFENGKPSISMGHLYHGYVK